MAIQYKALSCEKCGAPLQVPDADDPVTCTHCGVTLAPVRVGGDLVSLTCVKQGLAQVAGTTQRVADELELARAKEELKTLKEEHVDTSSGGIGCSLALAATLIGLGVAGWVRGMAPIGAMIGFMGVLFLISGINMALRDPREVKQRAARIAALSSRVDELTRRLDTPT